MELVMPGEGTTKLEELANQSFSKSDANSECGDSLMLMFLIESYQIDTMMNFATCHRCHSAGMYNFNVLIVESFTVICTKNL